MKKNNILTNWLNKLAESKAALALLCLVALVLSTGAFSINFRQSYVNHLVVQPGSNSDRMVGTNVAIFGDQTGTNYLEVSTNRFTLGTTNVGPLLAVRSGTNKYFAVPFAIIKATNNITGNIDHFVVRNGLICTTNASNTP